jgi:hypothetical protein
MTLEGALQPGASSPAPANAHPRTCHRRPVTRRSAPFRGFQAGDCGGTQDALDEMKTALGLKAPPPASAAFFQHKMQLILAAGCTPKPPVVLPR